MRRPSLARRRPALLIAAGVAAVVSAAAVTAATARGDDVSRRVGAPRSSAIRAASVVASARTSVVAPSVAPARVAAPAAARAAESPLVALARACAPDVAPETVLAVIGVESGGHPLALNVNGAPGGPQSVRAGSVREAVALARAAIAEGHSVDLGLMQVNSRNLAILGVALEEVLDPCTNVRAGARILLDGYVAAARRHGEGQAALRAALSAYNTGDFARGFRNGYVARYYGAPARMSVDAARWLALAAPDDAGGPVTAPPARPDALVAGVSAPPPDRPSAPHGAASSPTADPYAAPSLVYTRSETPDDGSRLFPPPAERP